MARHIDPQARIDAGTTSALCADFTLGRSVCTNPYCPRHQPGNYADGMARHATDSI